MTSLFFIFSFLLSLSLDKQIGLGAKRMQRPLNVYYRDYSANLSNEQRDKLMKIMLDDEGDGKPQGNLGGAIDMNEMHVQERELGALLKEQTDLSGQIREDSRGRTRKSDTKDGPTGACGGGAGGLQNKPTQQASATDLHKRMSIRYNHGENGASGSDLTEANEDGDHFDVDTEIDVPIDLMREPVVLVKIPVVGIYDQMEMLHDVGKLIDVNNEDVFY
ncbi:hypothetical protein C922_01637 [Plasmodium inui San Antonio 1]|uniref:Uncharacterized protein n=1 Tax=Plasmodium inui San Antonio 1 TaxID=1237626 RepID=W7A8N5_9APIC|nr:hypothetical protein C922_01637 [Plasmodium inui San Antonio 1]EUD68025.1 hypothetical protein C922_01637 [Plasmodium inui San Antonio 1]